MKNIISKVIDVGIFRLFFALSTIIYYSFAAKNTTQFEYSVLRDISFYVDLIPAVIAFGFPSIVPKLLSEGYCPRDIIKNVFIGSFLISLIIIVFLLINLGFSSHALFIIIISFITAFIQIFTAFIIDASKTRFLSISSFVITLAFFMLCSLSFKYTVDSNYFLTIRFFYAACLLVVPVLTVWKFYYKNNNLRTLDFVSFIKFSKYVGLSSLFSILAASIDKLIVKVFENSASFSEYMTGAFELPFVGLVTGAITSVLLSELCKSVSNHDYEQSAFLFKKITNFTIPVIIPLFFLFYCFSKDFISIVFDKKYADAYLVFDSYLFLLFARVIIFSPVMIALGLNRELMIRTIAEIILNVFFACIIIYSFGYNFVGYALVFTTFFFLIPYNIYSIVLKMNKEVKDLIPFDSLAFTIATFLVWFYFAKLFAINFAAGFSTFIALYVIFSYFYKWKLN